ncbi:class I SAM-dependent methyltransferase [Streptomyces sp. NPDC005925]|uniref:class I SAM-dependent methyltransferase n=1 Tax=Streptomyces sp. NPDC005925 TaxID=3157172 RepID=UPI0033C2F29B
MTDAVGETALWTLYHRSLAARDPECGLADPKAVELVEALDYPFAQRFGTDNRGWARGMAVRARCYDREVRAFLARHPRGTVVCLGEGLETQFWRVDNGTVRWLGVELPESAALRRRLLPDTDRCRTLTGCLLDERWTGEVDASDGVLVLAQGVLMYMAWDCVRALVEACAVRLPGAQLVFDTPPAWFAAGTVRGWFRYPAGYRPPPMSWGMTPARLRELRACPGVAAACARAALVRTLVRDPSALRTRPPPRPARRRPATPHPRGALMTTLPDEAEYSCVMPTNIAAIRALDKSGVFVREARLRHFAHIDGIWHDMLQYSVLEDDWRALRQNMPVRATCTPTAN